MNIFIVEDEELALSELKEMLDEFEANHSIFALNNGNRALELAQSVRCDLLITDIKMPGMNGLELIEKLKTIYRDLRAVILSGYDDFSYAQSGIKLGVKDYMLKPVRKAKLVSVVYQLIDEIQLVASEKKVLNEWTLVRVLLGQEEEKNHVDLTGSWLMIVVVIGNLNASVTWHKQEEKLTPLYAELPPHSRHVCIEQNKLCILIPDHSGMSRLNVQQWAQKVHLFYQGSSGVPIHTIGIYKSQNDQFKNQYKLALSQLEKQICLERSTLLDVHTFTGKQDLSALWEHVRIIEVELSSGDLDGAKFELARMIERLRPLQLTIVELESFLLDMFTAINYKLTQHLSIRMHDPGEIFTILKMIYTYHELAVWIEDKFHGYIRDLTTKRELQPKQLVQLLINQVRHAYDAPDSLQAFAHEYHISTGYLSRLFKLETGINFSEFVIRERIEQAKALLCLNELSLAEVANRVGYDDAKYFSQLFKKMVGCSPRAYQKLNKVK